MEGVDHTQAGGKTINRHAIPLAQWHINCQCLQRLRQWVSRYIFVGLTDQPVQFCERQYLHMLLQPNQAIETFESTAITVVQTTV